MKRLILLLVGLIVIGKLYVGVVVRLSKSPPTRAPHLSLDKALEEHLRMPPMADHTQIRTPLGKTRPVFRVAAVTAKPVPVRLATAPTVGHPATKAPVKTPAVKEETKRRRKRRKKLEEQIAKNQEPAPKPAAPTYKVYSQIQYQPPASGMMFPYGGGLPGTAVPSSTPASNNGTYSNPMRGASAGGTPVVTAGSGTGSANIASWQSLLVQSPTPSLMKSFVSMFNGKQITSSQFYGVLVAMEKSSVMLSRQFAVQAAALYHTIQSFQILADESQSETNGTIKGVATQNVMVYDNVNALPILTGAIESGDLNEKIVATSLVKMIVASYGNNKVPSNVAQNLTSLIPILTQLTQQSSPAELQANAAAALQEINMVIGSTATQPA